MSGRRRLGVEQRGRNLAMLGSELLQLEAIALFEIGGVPRTAEFLQIPG